jgi:hypothetical protein
VSALAIGRVVIFRSRTGGYDVPAIVTATTGSLAPAGVAAWEKSEGARGVPPLTAPDRVHLTVLTPGVPGQRATADDFLVESEHPVQENVGGTYQEWDVPFDAGGALGAGTWRWPERV